MEHAHADGVVEAPQEQDKCLSLLHRVASAGNFTSSIQAVIIGGDEVMLAYFAIQKVVHHISILWQSFCRGDRRISDCNCGRDPMEKLPHSTCLGLAEQPLGSKWHHPARHDALESSR